MSENKQLMLVETVKLIRMQYIVEVPVDEPAWALDVVTCNDAKTVSEKVLDETIVSSRVLTTEALYELAEVESIDADKIVELITREVEYTRK